jgi:hypothetical protein
MENLGIVATDYIHLTLLVFIPNFNLSLFLLLGVRG